MIMIQFHPHVWRYTASDYKPAGVTALAGVMLMTDRCEQHGKRGRLTPLEPPSWLLCEARVSFRKLIASLDASSLSSANSHCTCSSASQSGGCQLQCTANKATVGIQSPFSPSLPAMSSAALH